MMRIGIIGAGITGLCSAFELASSGHEVTVFERREAVAEEASFAHAGLLTAGLMSPAAAPGLRRWLLRGFRQHEAALRWRPGLKLAELRWLSAWWRASRTGQAQDVRAMTELAIHSLHRLGELKQALNLQLEQSRGVLVLLRDERELAPTHRHVGMLQELGWPVAELDPAGCLAVEPHLAAERLAGGLHLPDDGVGNCRQMAQQLRECIESRLGVEFRFGNDVCGLRRNGSVIELKLRRRQRRLERTGEAPRTGGNPTGDDQDFVSTQQLGPESQASMDAMVICTGADPRLLRLLAPAPPIQPVWGHSATFRMRPDGLGLNSAVIEAGAGITFSRFGQRIRVTGGFQLGGPLPANGDASVAPLYAALDRCFPHAATRSGAQIWSGARPMLPHGPPVIGAAQMPGVWFNLGHGAHGWTLACGSAQLLRQLVEGSQTCVDPAPFSVTRWSRP